MLNKSGITKTSYAAPTQILFNVANQMSVGITLAKNFSGAVTENGRKIVKAGTPLAGDLTARGTAFTAPTGTGASNTSVGVLLHDVDVTDAAANATLLIWGFVDLNKIDTTTAALITTDVKTALKGSVTFLK